MDNKTLKLTQFAVLLAILAVFCFTPLGSLPIGPIVATLAIIPVVIAGIMLGAGAGTLMGFFAGFFSFLVWTFMPPPTGVAMAFLFTPAYPPGNVFSLLICFVPRILAGTVAGGAYSLFARIFKGKVDIFAFALAGIFGSMTNTVFVLAGIYFFFKEPYEALLGGAAIMTVIKYTLTVNGLLEAAVGAVAACAVCKPLKLLLGRQRAS